MVFKMKIIGFGKGIPARCVSNDDIAQFLDTSDEWIFTRTGIKTRYVCTTETLTDLSVTAANGALEDAKLNPDDIDLIICATLGGDYGTPSLSCCIAEGIGAKCPCFDVNAACTGFIYALELASGFISSGKAKNVLIVSAEMMSAKTDWSDRNTCVLFGDGAAGCVVTAGNAVKYINLSSAAMPNSTVLNMPNGTGNSPFTKEQKSSGFLHMQGQEVFKFVVNIVESELKLVQERTGLSPAQIDLFLLHQANKRIIDFTGAKLKQPPEKFPCNIQRYGNLSSASIPLLLFETVKSGQIKPGDTLLLCAFGAGLTAGTCVIVWE
ncbi:MAG: ketoacyl-ACP synthase III [Oscillospiraceae bacterium]|nr:ketoacyl-ACP synthase III [Oscillospiraceae bacterium]